MSVKYFIITLLCIYRVYCQIDMYGNSEESKERAARDNSYSQENEHYEYSLKKNLTNKEDSGSAELINFLSQKNKEADTKGDSEEKESEEKKKQDSEVENAEENAEENAKENDEENAEENAKENDEENAEKNDNNALHNKDSHEKYLGQVKSREEHSGQELNDDEVKEKDIEKLQPKEDHFVQEFNDDEDEDIEEFKHHESDENEENLLKEELEKEREKQKFAGSVADYFGTNQHYEIPTNFYEFGRRFVLSYPYFEKNNTVDPAEMKLDRDVKEQLEVKKHYVNHLTPLKAPPEFVLAVAKQSAILEGTKPKNPSEDVITKNILRTGNFWNGVWKEDVDKKTLLRTSSKRSNKLEKVTVVIEPGSKLYELVSVLKRRSPVLLYVINKYNAD